MLASNSFNLVSPTINMEGVDIKIQGKGSIRNKTPNYIISADSITFNTANGAGGGAIAVGHTRFQRDLEPDLSAC